MGRKIIFRDEGAKFPSAARPACKLSVITRFIKSLINSGMKIYTIITVDAHSRIMCEEGREKEMKFTIKRSFASAPHFSTTGRECYVAVSRNTHRDFRLFDEQLLTRARDIPENFCLWHSH